jgi:NAD(P)-dependent dehydrogenase (short-subunit alcohol dehydrogenase family)
MALPKIIVFGPTGRVGSAVARSARQYGSKVVLAMRDPHKPIPGLCQEQELHGNYERIQADLIKPDTVQAAVHNTRAKCAFIYNAFGAPDHMKASITALKSAGIEFVVLLSSWAVQGDIRTIVPSNLVAWSHAQVEINLEDIFGPNGFAAVRPAWFASNSLWYKTMVPKGRVKLLRRKVRLDLA